METVDFLLKKLLNCRPPPKSKAFVVNWIAVLVPCEDGKDLEVIGNPFHSVSLAALTLFRGVDLWFVPAIDVVPRWRP